MGVPRNHVSVGNIGNPFEGVSRSFNDISKTFFNEAQREIDNARNRRVDEENIRQFDKQQAIRDAAEGRAAAEYKVGIDKANFLRDMANFNDTELRNKRLRDIGKLSEEQLQGESGDQARALVKLGRKEVSDAIKQQYNKQYGRTLAEGDLDAILGRYTDYATLQSNADTTARQAFDDRHKNLELRIDAAKAAKSSSSGGGSGRGSKGSSKIVHNIEEIDTQEKALRFSTEDGFFVFDKSSAADVSPAVRTARDYLAAQKDSKGNYMHPTVVNMMLDDSLREFASGDRLDRFRAGDTDEYLEYIDEQKKKFIANPKKYYDRAFGFSSRSGMPKELLDIVTDIASKGPAPYKSRNIQSERNTTLNSGLDKLLGRSKPAPVKSPKPVNSKNVDEKSLMEKLGIPGASNISTPSVGRDLPSSVAAQQEPQRDFGPVDLPNRYTSSVESLSPSVRSILDVDWEGRSQPRNRKEKLSKDYLEAHKEVLKATAKVRPNRDLDSEVRFVRDVRDGNEEDARKAIEALSKIRKELMSLS